MLTVLLLACADPPPPPPVPSPTGSTARWVEWRSPDDPVSRPVTIVSDVPGGPLDRIVADPDVTTFLNDRFHPVFWPPAPDRPAGTVRFFDACGCPLSDAQAPASPEAFIALANTVVVRPEATRCTSTRLATTCAHPAPPGL